MKKQDLQKIIREELQKLKEAAASKAQQQAAGIALSVKRGDAPASKLKDAGKAMVKMSEKELEKIAGTKHDNLPKKVKKEEVSLKEAPVTKDDLDKIGDFVMSSPAFEHMSPAKLKTAIKDMHAEWKAVASNYKSIEDYFDEMEKTGGEEAFMEGKKPSKSKKSLKEGYAWERSERKFGEPLPTLASVQKAYQDKQSVLKEAIAPSFKAKHKDNNLVAAIYFSWNKAESNNASLWTKVISLIEGQDCKLVNYVVTDSVCEFEFKPNSPAIDQDLLDVAKNKVELALKPLSSQWTGYDVYIVGN